VIALLFSFQQIYGIFVGGELQDSDGDGFIDVDDNSPDVFNPDQKDSDGDGVGDASDNCPYSSNPGQRDSDGDGKGDVCDVESDVSSYTNLYLNTEVTVSSGQSFDIEIVEGPEESVIDGVVNPVRVEFSDEIHWALIEIGYDDMVREDALEVHFFFEDIFAWYPVVDSGVDTVNNIVWANVTGSGVFSPIDTTKTESTAIYLKSRYFIPTFGVGPVTSKNLETMPIERVHVLLNFDHDLTMQDRDTLEKSGVNILAHIHSNGWFSSIPKGELTDIVENTPVTWMGEILPDDKMADSVRRQEFGSWSYDPSSGFVNLTVMFFEDVSLDDASGTVTKLGGIEIQRAPILNALVVSLPKDSINELIVDDSVQWVNEYYPPPTDFLDQSRDIIFVDTVQSPPYDLNGTDIVVGQWESGHPCPLHEDLRNRITNINDTIIKDHATHVAGILLGTGDLSGGLYRGMAPNATIISWYAWLNVGELQTKYEEAINTYDIDISTNSWGWTDNAGTYEETHAGIDAVVRGNITRPVYVVWAAGNEYDNFGNTSIAKPSGAKNVITVGSVDSDDYETSYFSSRGPHGDDRIKPDVVAAGCQDDGNDGINSTIPDLFIDSNTRECADGVPGPGPNTDEDDYCYPYDTMFGTSMATPAVSGCIALILQDFRDTHTYDPLPSTMKAILIHTAEDLERSGNGAFANDGPDYNNGWGLVNATAAIDLIRDDTPENTRIFEESISFSDERDADCYSFTVPAGLPELRVTLVWSDAPGVPNSALKDLENDLDLVVIDSTSSVYHPLVLDPANPGNVATPGVDDLNNVEQIRIPNPATGLWTIKVDASAIPYPPQTYSLVVTPALNVTELEPKRHSVALTLDSSGSMDWDISGNSGVPDEDTRLYKAQEGSKYFLNLLNFFYPNQATIGIVTYPDSANNCPSMEVIYPLTMIDDTSVVDAEGNITGMSAYGITPMAEGLSAANDMLTNPAENKTIVLFTDGYHNCPSSTDYYTSTTDRVGVLAYFNSILVGVKDKGIKVYTIGYGAANEVDHPLLQHIATETGAGGVDVGYYNASNLPVNDLVPAFKEVFVQGMGLESPVDPTVMIEAGGENTHLVNITEYDNKVAFTFSMSEALEDPLQFSVYTPDGESIYAMYLAGNDDIRYVAGGTYQIYFVKGSFLKSRPGEWEIVVHNEFEVPFEYSYGVITESTLKMATGFDKEVYKTGNSIKVTARLTGNTFPMTGAEVTVSVQKPSSGLGNWFADNPVTAEELAMVPHEVAGELLSDVYRASMALHAGGIDFPFTASQFSLELYDDGTHGDVTPGDGVYTNTYDDTDVEGVYTFAFTAKGVTPAGISYTREATSQRYVEVNVISESIFVVVDFSEIYEAEHRAYYIATVTPKDPFGNFLGPGYADSISLTATRGEFIGEVEDNLDGTYSLTLRTPSYVNEDDIDIGVNVGGVDTTVRLDRVSNRPEVEGVTWHDWLPWVIGILVELAILILIWIS